eukprot:m.22439 g.22439  ORF g.22439 m.22439 type:complete len:72 (-) comp11252_c0_seq1:855-1070(-)
MQATKKLSRAYTTNIIRLICAEVVASDCYAQESIMQGWQLVTKRMNVWYVQLMTQSPDLLDNYSCTRVLFT